MKWLALIVLLMSQVCLGVVPTIVQRVCYPSTGTTTVSNSAITYTMYLRYGSLSGNTVFTFLSYPSNQGTLNSITDDQGNTNTNIITSTDTTNTFKTSIFATISGATTNTRKIQANFAAFTGGTQFIQGCVIEVNNISISSPGDGTSANHGSGTAVTAGSLTTGTPNDFICAVAATDGGAVAGMTYTAGSGFTLTLTESADNMVIECGQQGSAGAINPSLTLSASDAWVSAAAAFKTASQGTAAPTGLHADGVFHEALNSGATSMVYQVVGSGNLMVMAASPSGATLGTNCTISTVTDSNSNSWASLGNTQKNTDAQMALFYTHNATLTNGMTITVNTGCIAADTPSVGNVVFYDYSGAATNPLDTAATCGTGSGGICTSTGTSSSIGSINTMVITPSVINGEVVSAVAVNTNSITDCTTPTGCNFIASFSSPDQQNYRPDQNNAYSATAYGSSLSAETNTYTQSAAVGDWAGIEANFLPLVTGPIPGIAIIGGKVITGGKVIF